MKTKKPKKLTERQCVQLYIKQFCKDAYVFVDTDSPFRVHKSGWDFLVIEQGAPIFYEAKKIDSIKGFSAYGYHVEKLLSTYQKQEAKKIQRNQVNYTVILFVDFEHTILVYEYWLYEKGSTIFRELGKLETK